MSFLQPVAEYIVANGLDVDEARELVKAVKDHERRTEGREVSCACARF